MSTIPVGFLVLAVILLVGGVPLAFALRDREPSDAPAPREAVSWAETLRSFFVNPRQHPDFFWAFVARLVLIVGYWSIVSFQLYILDDYIGLGLDKANELFPLTTAVLGLGIIVALVPSGLLSDRIGRRKPFVIVASFVVAVSAVVPILWPTVPGAITSVGLGGLGIGIYLAVDQALMTQVLPNKADAGKDLGVLNIAQAGGQIVAPLVASPRHRLRGLRRSLRVRRRDGRSRGARDPADQVRSLTFTLDDERRHPMEITQPLHRALQLTPDRTITVFGDRIRTVAESADRIARLAGALRSRGLQPGDRVGIMALNSDIFHEALLGIPWAGESSRR